MANFVKFLISLLFLALALIPTWAFLAVKHWLHPVGFWQKALVFGGGFYLFGGLQFVFLALLVMVLVAFWDNF